MSQITYFNVGVVAESYSNGALAYVDTQKGFIEDAADMLGMPAIMTAIAGAMAEENDSYGKDFGDETINLLSDYFALSAADPTQFFNRVMQFSDWKIGLAVAAAEFGVDLLPGTRRTHAQWQALYAQVNGQPDLGHGPLDKILNPVLMDMGQGNVKMATAIRLIETYQADATAVGINVAMYTSNYAQLANDLVFDDTGLTAKLYGLLIKEADAWYVSHGAYGADWATLPQEIKDALYITYTNFGPDLMQQKYLLATQGGTIPYEPMPGIESAGGLNHLNNAAAIAGALDVTGYGNVSFSSDSSTWVQIAQTDSAQGLAYREALFKLRGFVVEDGSYDNANGQLDLYDSATGQGNLSEHYLKDRAAMLSWKMQFINTGKVLGSFNTYYKSDWQGEDFYFEDKTSTLKIVLGSVEGAKRIIFGADGADTLDGSEHIDRLYGMGGNDMLNGGAGDDWLEGGAGHDILNGDAGKDTLYGGTGNDTLTGGADADKLYGGAGNDTLKGGTGNDTLYGGADSDTYIHYSGDGNDTIIDSDGSGAIKLNGSNTALNGGDKKSGAEGLWESADKQTAYSKTLQSNGKYTLTIILASGERLYVKDWENNQLGINLNDDEPEQPPTPAPNTNDHDYIHLASGGSVDGLNGNDILEGASGNEHLYGGADNDILLGNEGDDHLDGGTGNDILIGGAGRDTIHGGAGDDLIMSQTNFKAVIIHKQNSQGQWQVAAGNDENWREIAATWTWQFSDGEPGNRFVWWSEDPPTLGFNTEWNALDPLFALMNPVGTSESDTTQGDFIYGGEGNDAIYGSSGHDYIDGGADDDVIASFDGSDVIFGGSGNDEISGGNGNDYIDGESGNDVIIGGYGSDDLFGGEGNDQITGDLQGVLNTNALPTGTDFSQMGDDFIDAGAGNDNVLGGAGNDVIHGGDGDDELSGDDSNHTPGVHHGDDHIYGGAGNDLIWGNGGNDTIYGGTGNDHIEGDYSSPLEGQYHGDDYIDGGDGDDEIIGGGGSDIIFGGSGSDVISGDVGSDQTLAAEYHGDDEIDGGDGDDSIYGDGGNDRLLGGAGVDYIEGGDGDDYLDGGTGTDRLIGGAGNDTLVGGGEGVLGPDFLYTGGDILEGGEGDDTYRLGVGDAIIDNQGNDTVYFHGGMNLGSMVIQYAGAGSPLVVNVSEGQTFFIMDGLTRGGSLTYQLSDGAIDHADLLGTVMNTTVTLTTTTGFGYGGAQNDTLTATGSTDAILKGGGGSDRLNGGDGADQLFGGVGNDTLYGYAGNDTLVGGAGNDTLVGGTGSDTYLFGRGDGQDTISNNDSGTDKIDRLQFAADIALEDVKITRSSNNLIISILDSTDKVTVTNYFQTNGYSTYKLEEIHFGDGTILDIEAVKALVLIGGSGADQLYGYAGDDVLDGGLGNDTLYGGLGNDTLVGGEGNDTLVGEEGDDILDGGVGNDSLSGGLGSDTYLFSRGGGQDTINNNDSGVDKVDRLQFAADINPNDIKATRSNNNLVLTIIGSTDKVTITNYFLNDGLSSSKLEEISFADGTVWGLNEVKTLVLTGGEESDYLKGFSSNDILDGGAGDDNLDGAAGDDILYGRDGRDILHGEAGNDMLYGGADDDYLTGGEGSDIYYFDRGHGSDGISNYDLGVDKVDAIQYAEGINPEDILVSRNSASLELTIAGTNDKITVGSYFNSDGYSAYKLEEIRFFDGTVWDIEQIKNFVMTGTSGSDILQGFSTDDTLDGGEGDDSLYGWEGNDTLIGGDGNDYLTGHNGNDILDGGSGDDQLYGDAGSDTYLFGRGDGHDVINNYSDYYGAEDTDVLQFKEGVNPEDVIITRNSTSLVLGITGGSDQVLVRQYFKSDGESSYNLEEIRFANGTVWNYFDVLNHLTIWGTAVNDNLIGTYGDDIIDGLSGDDILDGMQGNDILYGGDGNDILSGGWGSDTLYGGQGNDLLYGNSSEYASPGGSNKLYGGDGDDILVGGISYNYIGNFFESGDHLLYGENGNDILYGGVSRDLLDGGNGDDTLYGDIGDDHLEGGEGNDVLYGGHSNDKLYGGEGNDTLYGENGADELYGGMGDDAHYGGDGSDKYIFQPGDGHDVIYETSQSTIDFDQVNIDVNPSHVNLVRSNNDLVLNYGDGDSVTFAGWYETDGQTIERINFFYDGFWVSWNKDWIASVAPSEDSASPGETVVGTSGNDNLVGTIRGDMLIGGLGDDTYVVNHIDDAVVESANEGIDTVLTSISYTLMPHLENATLTGAVSYNLTGNALNNVLIGNSAANILIGDAGDDILNGLSGADTMVGGLGNDTFVVDHIGDVVTENEDEGLDAVEASVSYTLGANIENLTLTGTSAINGTGNELDNMLIGNAAANVLDGGLGADTLSGGAGNDTYIIDNVDDIIIEASSEGTDLVQASVSYGLADNVENLTLTGSGNINGTGNGLANVITGNAGNNILDGGAGTDTLAGGAGDDTYIVDLTSTNTLQDTITEGANSGNDTVVLRGGASLVSTATLTLAANLENLDASNTGTTLLNLTGNASNNILIGNAANNNINGGVGADTMIGGAGDDIYTVDNVGDIVEELVNEGVDLINVAITSSGATYTLGANVENATLTSTVAINLTGNDENNLLIGNSAVNILAGGAGDDVLNGKGGADTLIGGLGNDTYIVDNAGDIVTELADEGIDTVEANFSYTLSSNVENLTLTGTSAINATGNDLDNILMGNSGANILDGGLGADTMIGGAGNDTYVVDNEGDVVVETASSGTDTVKSSISYTLGSNLEHLTLTGTADINATGNELSNTLTGNAGNNILDGGAGVDTLVGGAGDDTYIVDLTATNTLQDTITEGTSAGNDTIVLRGGALLSTAKTLTLATNLENLDASGTGTILLNLTGNASANILTGNAGNNTLNGGTGADTMIGGAGNDTYVVDNAGDVVIEDEGAGTDTVQSSISYSLGAHLEKLTLTGSTAINGTGNALDNTLTGNSGSNILDGGAGVDTLVGGSGNDTYIVDLTSTNALEDTVTEASSGGTDTIVLRGGTVLATASTITLAANVENLNASGTGTTLLNLTGNTLANTLIGNAADNILDGGAGADTMIGGLGNDTYIVNSTGDIVTELSDEGTDTIESSVSYTLSANVENLILTGTSAINGTGNALDNFLTGNSAANTLNGGLGNDILQAGAGNDSLSDSSGNNLYTGGAGTDTLLAGSGNDLLIGGTGNDTITTGTGYDIIAFNTGDGQDTVNASTGADNSISLGGGITYADLQFSKSGNNLILKTGGTDQITFKDWYASSTNKSVATLQVIAEAMADFDASGSDTLLDNKIETFDFTGLVDAFDQARAADTAITSWSLSDALLDFHLSGSDAEAIGGDLAYQYGVNGSLAGMGLNAAQGVMGAANFGQSAQTLNAPSTWQNEAVKLA